MDSQQISEPKLAGDTEVMDSRQQPVWHVLVLGFFTFNLYTAYWLFKTYSDLKREATEVLGPYEDAAASAAGISAAVLKPIPPRNPAFHPDEHTRETLRTFWRVNPALRTVGMLIPIVQIYIAATLTLGLANLVPGANSFPRRKPIVATLLVAFGFFAALTLGYLNHGYWMLASVAMIPVAVLQHWLNRYWDAVESADLMVRHGFNLWEMITIIIGASIIGLSIAGLMIGVKMH